MRYLSAIAFASLIALAPVASYAAKKPVLTPMQLQAIQQKEFDAPKAAVFSSVVDVFQDLGYSLGSADMNTGFITAESATVNKTSFWDALAEFNASGSTRATAFIEQMPSGMTRVRLNFVSTKQMSGSWGRQMRQDQPIQEPVVYQRAFEKVDEALFVRKAVNAPTAAPSGPPPGSTPPPPPSPQPTDAAKPTS
jgi:hypothetical protein